MTKVERLLKAINAIVKADNDDLQADLEAAGFPDPEKLVGHVEDFETKLAQVLTAQRKFFVDALDGFTAKAEGDEEIDEDTTLADFLNYVQNDLFAADEFAASISAEAAAFLNLTVPEIAAAVMEAIDPDIPFIETSKRSVDWIESWSEELGQIMQTTAHEAVGKVLTDAIADGLSVEEAVLHLKDLPEFDRTRARTTAITEILTASSVAQQEAYSQSPAVTGKTWRHSGSKKNHPREAHVALDGTTIPVDDHFDVNGHAALYPRDTALPAKERIRCHCTQSPDVDEKILGLSKEEKEKIRQQVLADLNA